MKVVILAGGLGTRMREETEFKPKPMVEVGGKPILWHIMNHFISHGFNDFIIAAGYKSEIIKNYFYNFVYLNSDFSVNINDNISQVDFIQKNILKNFKVTVVDTGAETLTGGRLFRLKQYLDTNDFICTYGDGLSNVNIKELVSFHLKSNKLATLTAVQPLSRFGLLNIDQSNNIIEFNEKPQMSEWINGGYFVFKPEVFKYISENSVLEADCLPKLAINKQLQAFRHSGFWRPMDTYREFVELNDLWRSGNAPWAVL